MNKVLVVQNSASKYGVLGSMTEALQAALEQRGVQTLLYRAGDLWTEELARGCGLTPPDCSWSINIFVGPDCWYGPAGIPHVNLSVDSWTYCHPQAISASHLVSLFVDKTSRDSFLAHGGQRAYWFPHAIASTMIDRVRHLPSIPLQDRPLDVVVVGSYLDHRAIKSTWEERFAPAHVAQFVDIAERSLIDPSCIPIEEVLQFILRTPQLQAELKEHQLSPADLANTIETYARGLDRERLLKSFPGRKIQIYTDPNDALLWSATEEGQHCLFMPPVPFDEVIDICRQAKVVVNSAPHIRIGFHERLFLSLASGAVTVVGKGRLPPWLVAEARIAEYDGTMEGLLLKVEMAERRPFDKERILSWLEAEHTWQARLNQLLPQIERDVHTLHERWESL
jgi:hypothetical protein